jgi:N-acetylmuramoyl-L-alanine amidase
MLKNKGLNRPFVKLAIFGLVLATALLQSFGEGQALAQTSLNAAESDFQKARAKYYSLITSRQTGDETEWQVCVEMFRKVSHTYPESRRAADALFTEGLLYWNMHQRFDRQESLYQAVQAYEQLVNLHPSHTLADDALYNIAVIYSEDMGDKTQAIAVLQRLKESYPRSEMAQQASLLLSKLRSEKPAITPHSVQSKPVETVIELPSKSLSANQSLMVQDIRYWSNPDYTRVSIYLNKKATFNHRLLKKDPQQRTPNRLYLDIEGAKLGKDLSHEIAIQDSQLMRVRSGQFTLDTARVVLDLNSIYDYQIASRTDPDRIIIDIQGSQPKQIILPSSQVQPTLEPVAVATPTATPVVEMPTTSKNDPIAAIMREQPKTPTLSLPSTSAKSNDRSLSSQPILPYRTIILDPGHGGDDPGAKGPSGTQEKDVVLDIALKLRDELSRYKDIRVVMTRDTDVFVPLPQRSLVANEEHGNLFVSIHANASPHHNASGISTYVFDNAKDEYSKRLEEVENASIMKGEKDEQDFLTLMFKSMTKNYFTNLSVELAVAVQGALMTGLKSSNRGARDLGVRQAMFYVLWNTEMPAILVETSFISNRKEESLLRSTTYQAEMARSIATGLKSFLEQRYAMRLSRR